MSFLLLVGFIAVFANGQTPAWERLTRLANQRQEVDDLAGAERLRREALRAAEEKLGPEDTLIASLLANVAQSLHLEGRDADADPLLRRALLIAEGDLKLKGKVLNTLGIVLAGEGDRARAEPVLRRSVALLEEAEGKDSLDAAKALNNLATLYTDTRQYAKAELEMRRALPIYETHLGADHPMVALVSGNMFTILNAQHRSNEGEPYLRHALAIGEKAFPQTLKMANLELCLASLEAGRGNLKEAARLLEKVIAMQERLLGPQHPDLAQSLVGYSIVLRGLHQKSEAKIVQNRANLILKSALSNVK